MANRLPTIISNIAPDLRRFLERIREEFDEKNPQIRQSDLIKTGLFKLINGVVSSTINTTDISCIAPPAPVNLSISGAMTSIFLTWEGHTYNPNCHSYTEVWRSSIDDFGTASLLGTSIDGIYVDAVGAQASYYYWIRFYNKNNVVGPLNDGSGTLGQTAPDVGYLLSQLNNSLSESELVASLRSRIDNIDASGTGLLARMSSAEVVENNLQSQINDLNTTPDYISTDSYILDDLVKNAGSIYRSLVTNSAPSVSPPDTNYWQLVGNYNSIADIVAANTVDITTINTNIGATDIQALATNFTALTTTVGTNTSAIATETTSRTNADTALASDIALLNTSVGDNEAAIISESTARASADSSMALSITTLQTESGDNIAAIQSEVTARTNANTALSSSISALTTTVNDNAAIVANETVARTDADTALASDITTLQTSVGNNTSSISTESTTRATKDAALEAQYTVKVDINGYVSGFGLASTLKDDTPFSEFAIVADKFSIAPTATDPNASDGSPFFHLTSSSIINGVTVPPGTYMKSANIHNAAITNAMIGNATIDNAKIVDGTIQSAKIGDAQVTNAKIGQIIQSDNYTGTSGWQIDKNGNAVFGAITIRDSSGNVLLSSGGTLGASITNLGATADWSNIEGQANAPASNATATSSNNMFFNGALEYSDNRGWGAGVFNPTASFDGGECLEFTGNISASISQRIKIDNQKHYRVAATLKMLNAGNCYFGVVCYDKDGINIKHEESFHDSAYFTTLAATLNVGDAFAVINAPASWSTYVFHSHIMFDVVADGSDLPNRNLMRISHHVDNGNGTWNVYFGYWPSNGTFANDLIPITSTITQPLNTQIGYSQAGSSQTYVLKIGSATTNWENLEGVLEPYNNPNNAPSSVEFRPNTRYISMYFVQPTATTTYIDNIGIIEQTTWESIPNIEGTSFADALNNIHQVADNADVTANSDFVNTVYPADKAGLQTQIDGKVETWFSSSTPSWSNPNSEHEGDIWWNPTTKVLKYYSGTAWSVEMIDQKTLDAFNNAATAQATADSKVVVFTVQPTVPYDIGDLWDVGGILRRSTVVKTSGQSFSLSDWVDVATKNRTDGEVSIDINSAATTADWVNVKASDPNAPADNADATNYADYRVSNSTLENGVLTIARPVGATLNISSNTNAGVICIVLPQSWSNTMMKMEIDIFQYNSAKSLTVKCGGYNYTGNPTPLWSNEFAQVVGEIGGNNRVRFGHNGTKCVILVGDTSSNWSYPKITVKNFQAGHSNFAVSQWDANWSVLLLTDLSGITISGDFPDALLDAKSIVGQGALATSTLTESQANNANTTPADIGYTGDLDATNGAEIGVDLTGVFNQTSWNVVMPNALIDTAHIKALAVDTAHIKDAAINTAHIVDANVTNAKIADLSVTNAKIADLSVTNAKIADLSVTKLTGDVIERKTGYINREIMVDNTTGALTSTSHSIAYLNTLGFNQWYTLEYITVNAMDLDRKLHLSGVILHNASKLTTIQFPSGVITLRPLYATARILANGIPVTDDLGWTSSVHIINDITYPLQTGLVTAQNLAVKNSFTVPRNVPVVFEIQVKVSTDPYSDLSLIQWANLKLEIYEGIRQIEVWVDDDAGVTLHAGYQTI